MVAGIEVDVFRPDDELSSWPGWRSSWASTASSPTPSIPSGSTSGCGRTPKGRQWLSRWDEAADPWFDFSSGSGFYHSDRVWNEHREIPFAFIRDYAARVRRGEDLARPLKRLHAERDRITSEYAALMPTDADRAAFHEKLRLAPRWSSPTWRTTTSTSSTGRTR